MSKEREKKMSLLQQKVYEMTEQIKSLTTNKISGARIMQLEAELDDKTRYIEDMEFSYKNRIDDLQLQLNDKTRALNQLKEKHYMEIQFQAELDNKNRSINDLKLKHKEKVLKLKEEIKDKNEVIESLKEFESQTIQLKRELESKDSTISQLESEIQSSQIISNQYEASQETQKKLKSDIAKLKKFAKTLSIEKTKVEKELEKSIEQIKLQKNEISVLKAEKSFAQTQISRSDVIFSGSPQKISKRSENQTPNSKNGTFLFDIPDNNQNTNNTEATDRGENNLDDEEMLKALLKIDRLRLELNEEKEKTTQSQELIEALKTNLKETQTDNQNMKSQLTIIESAMTRKDSRIQKLKQDIAALNNQIKQKEQLINELLTTESKKSDEIERLHQEIDKLINTQKETRIKENKEDENVFRVNKNEYQKLLDTINQFKKEKLQLETNYKQNQNRTKELESQLQSMKRNFTLHKQKISNLTKENVELATVKDAYSKQVRQIEKELTNQVTDLKISLEETTKENSLLSRQYKDAIQSLSTYTSSVDSLRTENTKMKLENSQLQMSIHQQVETLQSENSRLSENAKKFKEARDVALKEKQQLIIENAQFKAQIEYLTSTRKGRARSTFEFNPHEASFNELEDKYNEVNDSLMTLLSYLEVKSIDEFQKKWQKNIEETENLLSKNKLLEQQTESLKNRLDKFSSKFEDGNVKQTDSIAENQLRKELTQEKKKAGSFQNQTELLQQQINQLENENREKSNEINEIKRSLSKYKNEIDSLHNCIQFESIENLKDEITNILSEKAQDQMTIKELNDSIKKLQNEKSESIQKIEKNQETIESMNSSIKELRNENLTSINQLRIENTELKNRFQIADDKKESLLSEFNRFHESFTFDKEEDLYFIVTSEMEKLKSAIEDSNFKLSQCQNKLNSKESECNFLNNNLNEKKEMINKLKEERNSLKNENFKLASSVKAAMNDTSLKQLEEIASLLEKENVSEILPTISRMISKQHKHKSKITRLKNEIEKLNDQINAIQTNLNNANLDKEKVENELESLKISLSTDADSTSKIESKLIEKDDKISELNEKNSQFIQFLSERDDKIKALEVEISNKTKELNQAQLKMQQINNSLSETKDLLNQKNSENENFKTQLNSIKSNSSIIENLREKNQLLNDQLEASKLELIKYQKESENLLKSQSDSINRIKNNHEKEKKRLQDKINQLEKEKKEDKQNSSFADLVNNLIEEEEEEHEIVLKNNSDKMENIDADNKNLDKDLINDLSDADENNEIQVDDNYNENNEL